MKKYFIIVLLAWGQLAQAMNIESFEKFAFSGPDTLEYSAARLWIDGMIAGTMLINDLTKGSSGDVLNFPAITDGRICLPPKETVADVFMYAGKREISERRDFYFKSKLGKTFPMEIVLWNGMKRYFPCEKSPAK